MEESTTFSGEIYKLFYAIGSREFTYTKGQILSGVGIEITKMVSDSKYKIETGGDKILVFARPLNGGYEFIYDEIKSMNISIKRENPDLHQ